MKGSARAMVIPLKFSEIPLKSAVILLSAAVLLTVHRYYGSIASFERLLGPHLPGHPGSLLGPAYMFLSAFVLMGVVPVVLIKYVFKEPVSTYGLQLGNLRWALSAVAILLPIVAIILLLPSARMESFRAVYPLYREAGVSLSNFLLYELLRGLFFYSAWEFYFRGFILRGLREVFGDWNALLIQTIPSCLWHIGYPEGEIFGSIAGGFLFGFLVLRTNSLLAAFVLHWGIGIALDSFIVLNL